MVNPKQRMINYAEEYAQSTGRTMQVIWSEHGGYQVFPAKVGCSVGYRQIYVSKEDVKE